MRIGFSEREVCEALGRSPEELRAAAAGAATGGYRPFALRVAGKKARVIHAPRPWLKTLQREILDRVLHHLPVGDCVYSRPGRDVVGNARAHLGRSHMAVLDIADCFPSTRHARITAAFRAAGFDEHASGLLTRLTTCNGLLPQGPPTSPAVLNLVLAPMDDELARLAGAVGGTYTRYMDDLCFSADCDLGPLSREATRVMRRYQYQVSRKKRKVWGPEDPHTVTKIVVTSSLNPTAEYVAALARELANIEAGGRYFGVDHIAGRIEWVRRLNPQLGRALRARFADARRTGRTPDRAQSRTRDGAS